MLFADGWNDPNTWMQVADRFGVAVLVIFAFGLFIATCMTGIWLIYRGWEPLLKKKASEIADSHTKFVETAAASIDIHAKANANHAAAHVISAESLKAISEAVEEGIEGHRDRLSDLVRIVHGGLAAVGEGLEELEVMHKDNQPMLKAIGQFRVRLASMREFRKKSLKDSDG